MAKGVSESVSELNEVGKTISAATAEKIQTAIDALQALLMVAEAETPEDANIAEAVTKTEGSDGDFPAGDYAYVPDAQSPSTWKLRLTATPGGAPDAVHTGAAAAALGPNPPHGQRVQIPDADLPAVKAKVRTAWTKAHPDQAADMPASIKESAESESMPLAEEHIELIERAVGEDGLAHIKLIAPGWGSSGYYPPAVLARDGPNVFREGLHMHIDHQTEAERKAKQEGSLKDFAGTLASDAHWEDNGPAGPGLYADAQVFEPYRAMLNEMAPHIGVSIRANGNAVRGEAEGRKGHIIEAITAANTTDYVTRAGAGGAILPLTESAPDPMVLSLFRGEHQITTEVRTVDEQEAQGLRAENARLREALLLREARDMIVEALSKVDMPEPTRARLTETLAKNPPVTDGALDVEVFNAAITEAAKAEIAYIASVSGSGAVRGMGASAGGNGPDGNAALKESFRGMYLRQGKVSEEAEKLAALAAGR